MKRICTSCHAVITDDTAVFCSQCGAQLPLNTANQPAVQPISNPAVQPTRVWGKCVACGRPLITPRIEEARMTSKYGMKIFRFQVVICPHCHYSHFYFLS